MCLLQVRPERPSAVDGHLSVLWRLKATKPLYFSALQRIWPGESWVQQSWAAVHQYSPVQPSAPQRAGAEQGLGVELELNLMDTFIPAPPGQGWVLLPCVGLRQSSGKATAQQRVPMGPLCMGLWCPSPCPSPPGMEGTLSSACSRHLTPSAHGI